MPDPGYPPYRSGTIFAMAEPYTFPLTKGNKFLPDLDSIPRDVAERAKIMFVNYPNNPTGATATIDFFKKLVEFGHKYGILVVHDAAYIELYYEDPQPSFLSVDGAKEVGIEVHSMTKTFNMAGWRIAWACGNAAAIETLRSFKANCDSGQFKAMQKATAHVLLSAEREMQGIRSVYRTRRDIMISGLRELGWAVESPRATFYIWFEVPKGNTSGQYCDHVLNKANVVFTPGNGFGSYGEGFARIALTTTPDRLRLALERLKGV
jgi:LL-diaminopimelate aminotransferase